MPEIVPVTCKMCHGGDYGEKASCLTDIKLIVEDGDIAFMLYSEHVREKLEELGYKLKLKYTEGNMDCPIGMWIMK